MAIRWRKEPNETGLARVCQSPRGYELRNTETGEWIIMVAPANKAIPSWYWYGLGRNTCAEGLFFETKEDAKIDADKAYKSWRKIQV